MSKRMNVLVVLDDMPAGATLEQVEAHMSGAEFFDREGQLVGKIGLAAVCKNARELTLRLMAEQISADGVMHPDANEPYRKAGDALVDAALEYVS